MPARILCPDDHPDRYSGDRAKAEEAFASVARALRDEVLPDPKVRWVVVLVGAPGSGKSTLAQQVAARRSVLLGPRPGASYDPVSAREPGPESLVIVDACHANKGRRTALAKRIRAAGKVAVAVVLHTPLEVCVERDAQRQPPRRVGRQVVERVWRDLRSLPPLRSEGWSEVVTLDPSAPDRLTEAP